MGNKLVLVEKKDMIGIITLNRPEKMNTLIAKKSPQAVQTGKAGIYRMSEIPYHQALDYMDEMFASLSATEDALEGIDAFMEKREPVWKNR